MAESEKAKKSLILGKGEGLSFRIDYSSEDDKVHVSGLDLEDAQIRSRLRESHPALFGRLLAAHDAIHRAGGLLVKLIWLASALAFAAIGLEWLYGLGNLSLLPLASFWGGLLFLAVTLFLANRVGAVCEALAWARLRTDLLRAINDEGFELSALLTAIEADAAVGEVAERLKKEAGGAGRF